MCVCHYLNVFPPVWYLYLRQLYFFILYSMECLGLYVQVTLPVECNTDKLFLSSPRCPSSHAPFNSALLAATPSPVVFCHNDVQEGKNVSCLLTPLILGWGEVINRSGSHSYASSCEWKWASEVDEVTVRDLGVWMNGTVSHNRWI